MIGQALAHDHVQVPVKHVCWCKCAATNVTGGQLHMMQTHDEARVHAAFVF